MIQIKNLKKRYGSFLLDIAQLKIENQNIYGIVGRNGVGKTTLLRLLFHLIEPDSGSILYNNINIYKNTSIKERGELRAYLNDKFLIPFLTPLEYLEISAQLLNISDADFVQKLKQYHEFLPEGYDQKSKLIKEFSAGNKVRLGIVGAILNDPSVLLLDELTNSLDQESASKAKVIIRDYVRRHDAAAVWSTHRFEEITQICDNILVIEAGHVKYFGPARDFHSTESHRHVYPWLVTDSSEDTTQYSDKCSKLGYCISMQS